MSKPVRIKDYVAVRVEEVASVERRSFANMVEVLLLAALSERVAVGDRDAEMSQPPARSVSADPSATIGAVGTSRNVCAADTPRGVKCKLCGKVH